MTCREFRRKHDAYVDDTLSGVDVRAMALHIRDCKACARRDLRIRRALLVARNLPTIHPSPEFSVRLDARLRAERARVLRGERAHPERSPRWRTGSRRTYAAVAAALVVTAGAGLLTRTSGDGSSEVRLAPVLAAAPESAPAESLTAPLASPVATRAMLASMPAGMPVWPAVFVAQQASWHLAGDALDDR